jgi:hypothetical protein
MSARTSIVWLLGKTGAKERLYPNTIHRNVIRQQMVKICIVHANTFFSRTMPE